MLGVCRWTCKSKIRQIGFYNNSKPQNSFPETFLCPQTNFKWLKNFNFEIVLGYKIFWNFLLRAIRETG